MKKIVSMAFLAILCLTSCVKEALRETAPAREKSLTFQLRESDGAGITGALRAENGENLQIFIFDPEGNSCMEFSEPDVTSLNGRSISLPYGTYRIVIVSNVSTPDEISFPANPHFQDVQLFLRSNAGLPDQASDLFIGESQVTIDDAFTGTVTLTLMRRVGMIRLILENIPSDARQIRWSVKNVPQRLNLEGIAGSETVTLIHDAAPTDGNRSSSNELLLFPGGSKPEIRIEWQCDTLSYSAGIVATNNIYANKITVVKGTFPTEQVQEEIAFSISSQEWESTVIDGGWFDLVPSQNPDEPQTANLLLNGDFELWEASPNGAGDPDLGLVPSGWKFYASGTTGSDKIACRVAEPLTPGAYAVRLEGKSCLYQDIAVTPGKSYRISLPVYSPNSSTRWRYYSSWRQSASTGGLSEESAPLQTTSYLGVNERYTNVYAGKIFTAPAGAALLRVEVRSYDPRVAGEGLYLDNVVAEEM